MKTSFDDSRRQLTLRMPQALILKAKAIAKRRKTTVNALLVALVEACDRAEEERALSKAYELLGHAADVGFAHDAQAEVACDD